MKSIFYAVLAFALLWRRRSVLAQLRATKPERVTKLITLRNAEPRAIFKICIGVFGVNVFPNDQMKTMAISAARWKWPRRRPPSSNSTWRRRTSS